MRILCVCSGGLDSVVLSHKIANEHELAGLVSFDYGQRHKKELEYASNCANALGVSHDVIDITEIGKHLTGNALTQDIDVPHGHYEEDTMKITIVPNRNAIMLAIAFGVAASKKADAVATAVHGGDHFIYPDCRPEFVNAFETMQKHALEGYADISLYTPFVHAPKSQIVVEGNKINAPFVDTWSCYKGNENHCGACGTCVERREAFHIAGVNDPTKYEDKDFWLNAVKQAGE